MCLTSKLVQGIIVKCLTTVDTEQSIEALLTYCDISTIAETKLLPPNHNVTFRLSDDDIIVNPNDDGSTNLPTNRFVAFASQYYT